MHLSAETDTDQMEDPLTGDFPSRNILAEEDEFAISRNLKSLYSAEPFLSLEVRFLFHACDIFRDDSWECSAYDGFVCNIRTDL